MFIIITGLIFLLVFIANWIDLTAPLHSKKRAGSLIPFIGGCMGGVCLYLLNNKEWSALIIIPFLIDAGSFPIILNFIINIFYNKQSDENTREESKRSLVIDYLKLILFYVFIPTFILILIYII